MRKRTAWVLVAAIAVVAFGVATIGLVALVVGWKGGARLGGPKYLDVRVEGGIDEWHPTELSLLGERAPVLLDIVRAVDDAAGDERVEALLVRIGPLDETGWARVQDVRDVLLRFSASGKSSTCYLEGGGNKEYYLATGCGEIVCAPTALLNITGLALQVSFFRGTLDKLGIEAQFEGVGRYKNAPNQYLERGMTEPHREQLEALLDDLHGQFVAAVSEARELPQEEVQRILDEGPHDGESAREAGLLDELLYATELEERLGENAERLTVSNAGGSRGFGVGRPKIAVVHVEGEIVPGRSSNSPFGGSAAGADSIARALETARLDGTVKAIVLRVNSPGGVGSAADAIWREVERAREAKPVIASFSDTAASGGYYVAMGADVIVSQPATLTGSIGVFGGKLSLKGFYGKIGISKEEISRGRRATMFSDYHPWDDEERARIQTLLRRFYETFVQKAAEGRGLARESVDAVAQGRVWTGAAGKEHHLVDEIGGISTAIEIAKARAGLAPDQAVSILVLPRPKGLFEALFERETEQAIAAHLPDAVRWALNVAWAQQEGGGLMARVPFDVSVR